MRTFFSCLVLAVTLLPTAALSQQKVIAYYDQPVEFSPLKDEARPSLIESLSSFVIYARPSITFDQFIQNAMVDFGRMTDNRSFIDTEEYSFKLAQEVRSARLRQTIELLKYDENLDGILERDEVVQILLEDTKYAITNSVSAMHAARYKQADDIFLKHDLNKDGVISFAEMTHIEGDPVNPHPSRSDKMYSLLQQDRDGDGKITTEEAKLIFTALFHELDADQDGTISQVEQNDFSNKTRRAKITPACVMESLDKKARVLVLGTKSGEYYSTTDLKDAGKQVSAVNLQIEKQAKPLVLFLLAQEPTIFNLKGDLTKIEKVVLPHASSQRESQKRIIAVTNVAKERVVFESDGCNYLLHNDSIEVEESFRKAFLDRFGRSADIVVGQKTIGDIILHPDRLEFLEERDSSKRSRQLNAGDDRTAIGRMRKQVRDDYKLGIMSIDPSIVVSRHEAQTYKTYPGFIGLIKLIEDGSIASEGGEYSRTYRLVKPISQFPGNLGGANSVTFIVPDEFELPSGDLGHSCAAHRGMVYGLPHCQHKLQN